MLTVIIIFVALGLLAGIVRKVKERRSPYFLARKQAESKLAIAELTDDWSGRQYARLILIWLEVHKVVEASFLKDVDENTAPYTAVAKLSPDELTIPILWRLDNPLCYTLSMKIVKEYAQLLQTNPKLQYREEDLPVPRFFIFKSMSFLFDHLNFGSSPLNTTEKEQLAKNLNFIRVFMTPENSDMAQLLAEELQLLDAIDWRSVKQWLLQASRFADSDQFDLALACCKHAETLDPNHSSVRGVTAIIYLSMGEWHIEHGNTERGIEAIRNAAGLGNAEAQEMLSNFS